jgi:hypothetical protein
MSQDGQIIAQLRTLFGAARTVGSDRTMPALLAIGRQMGAAAGEDLIDRHPELQEFAGSASRDYLEYIYRLERAEAGHLLNRTISERFRYLELAEAFGRHNYERVRDMFDAVDFKSCRRFVLVGCGPLPMTLYHVHDRTEVVELIAIDIEDEAVGIVNETARRFGLNRISAAVASGEQYDYSQADIIYVANLVRPKRNVLERIADMAPAGAMVVLREPYSLGRLLTERGVDHLDPRLEIVKVSPPELSHFSRHVFLRTLTPKHV